MNSFLEGLLLLVVVFVVSLLALILIFPILFVSFLFWTIYGIVLGLSVIYFFFTKKDVKSGTVSYTIKKGRRI
jgi:hypothetical protein